MSAPSAAASSARSSSRGSRLGVRKHSRSSLLAARDRIFGCGAQDLAHAPGLGKAAARAVRRVAVGDLRQLPQAAFIEALAEGLEPLRDLPASLRGAVRPPVG